MASSFRMSSLSAAQWRHFPWWFLAIWRLFHLVPPSAIRRIILSRYWMFYRIVRLLVMFIISTALKLGKSFVVLLKESGRRATQKSERKYYQFIFPLSWNCLQSVTMSNSIPLATPSSLMTNMKTLLLLMGLDSLCSRWRYCRSCVVMSAMRGSKNTLSRCSAILLHWWILTGKYSLHCIATCC